jgi:hypothetical protein
MKNIYQDLVPQYHAQDCKNLVLKGNDKQNYISKLVGKSYRWIKQIVGKSAYEYFTQFPIRLPIIYDIKSINNKL